MKEKLPFLNWLIENNIPYESTNEGDIIRVDEEVLEPHYQTLMKLFPEFKPYQLVQREDAEPKNSSDENTR